jgi:hypothetical protein
MQLTKFSSVIQLNSAIAGRIGDNNIKKSVFSEFLTCKAADTG